jgi:hypothetical protein
MGRIALGALPVLAGGLTAVAGGLVGASSGPSADEPALPPSPRSVLAPSNVPLGPRPAAYWAPVVAVTAAYRRPGGSAVVAKVRRRTPEGTTNIVLVTGQAVRRARRLWVRVRVPGLPDDVHGWLTRSALGGYAHVRTRLVVDLNRLTATLLRHERRVFRAPVAIGTRSTPTPRGNFYIRSRLHRYSSPFYGPVAFGTSARARRASDWPAGGFVGIHGTNRPDLIPGRISHGCIRMTNADIMRLARLMRVGTPLTVR